MDLQGKELENAMQGEWNEINTKRSRSNGRRTHKGFSGYLWKCLHLGFIEGYVKTYGVGRRTAIR